MSTWLWRLCGAALWMFGGGVGVFVKGWPGWRPVWGEYVYVFVVCGAVVTTCGLVAVGLVLQFREYGRRFDETAARIAQGQALDAAKAAQSETALDVLFGDKPEQRGLTTRHHLAGGVYSGSNDGRRTAVTK